MSQSWILDHEDAKPAELGYYEWDSDDDHDVTLAGEGDGDDNHSKRDWACSLDHLGYHPDKEIAFLASLCDGGGHQHAPVLG